MFGIGMHELLVDLILSDVGVSNKRDNAFRHLRGDPREAVAKIAETDGALGR